MLSCIINKVKEKKVNVQTSKPKQCGKKVGMVLVNIGLKIKQNNSTQPYITTALCLLLYSGVGTYVYESGLSTYILNVIIISYNYLV